MFVVIVPAVALWDAVGEVDESDAYCLHIIFLNQYDMRVFLAY